MIGGGLKRHQALGGIRSLSVSSRIFIMPSAMLILMYVGAAYRGLQCPAVAETSRSCAAAPFLMVR
jgi:hypothetical protein